MTKVSVIKWSQKCTRIIKSGVVGILKYLKNACKVGYFNNIGYAKNTTSDGPSSILRPLKNRFFCHIQTTLGMNKNKDVPTYGGAEVSDNLKAFLLA